MSWLLLIVGLLLAILGSAGAAALVTSARSALPDAISRRLRGGQESFGWLAESERLVVGAMAVSSLGVVIMGVAIPGIFDRITLPQLVLLLLFLVGAGLGLAIVFSALLGDRKAKPREERGPR